MKNWFPKNLAPIACAAVFAFATATAVQGEEPKAPIVYLPFAEIKNGKTPNLGSVFCEATVAGEVKPVDGKFGKAIAFTGSNAIANVPLSLSEAAPYGITISVWLKCNGAQDGYGTIFDAGPGNKGLYIRLQSANYIDCSFGSVWHAIQTAPSPDLGKVWTHLVLTYDQKVGRLYVDGKLMGEKAVEFSPDYGTEIAIGKRSTPDSKKDKTTSATIAVFYPFNGAMEDFKIFDYAFTPEDAAKMDR